MIVSRRDTSRNTRSCSICAVQSSLETSTVDQATESLKLGLETLALVVDGHVWVQLEAGELGDHSEALEDHPGAHCQNLRH